eukprot:CAMPEP_0184006842 /NCGR_PEP_ID=MMETSP0954-20121128/948_1 /TAXON_ID=627963 /ORGANISM="Aplanochytrium sp, Strain PBS07" /LENGTH=319 /DNA_ID=CAMNT_0026285497 /DNA_START=23 /DNA_END=982 /DNA_ORIENTATION=+
MTKEITFMHTIIAHRGDVTSLAIRENEIWSGGDDKRLKLWDLTSEQNTQILPQPSAVTAISIDYDVVFCSSGKILRAYDKKQYKKVIDLELHGDIVGMSLDQKRMLYTVENNQKSPIRKWDVESMLDTTIVEVRNGGTVYMSELKRMKSREVSGGESAIDIHDILDNPKKRQEFMAYLRDERYADENLLFWIAANRYKAFCKSSPDVQSMQDMLNQFGVEIVQEYVEEGSEREINIDDEMRDSLIALSPDKFSPDSFDEPIKAIEILMEMNFLYSFENEYGSETFEKPPERPSLGRKAKKSSRKARKSQMRKKTRYHKG